MATVIKFKVDGMEFNVQSLNYGLNSFADVSNPTQEIDFQPVSVSEFSFSILPPTKDDGSNLVQWLTEHEVKGSASFSINKQKTTEKQRLLSDIKESGKQKYSCDAHNRWHDRLCECIGSPT